MFSRHLLRGFESPGYSRCWSQIRHISPNLSNSEIGPYFEADLCNRATEANACESWNSCPNREILRYSGENFHPAFSFVCSMSYKTHQVVEEHVFVTSCINWNIDKKSCILSQQYCFIQGFKTLFLSRQCTRIPYSTSFCEEVHVFYL